VALASYLGYELKQIADALEVLLAAGLIKRTQSAAGPAQLYVLVVDSVSDQWLPPLVEMASTRQGRAMLKKALAQRSTEGTGGPGAATRVETIGKTVSPSFLVRGDARGIVVRRSHTRGGQ
jgi:hypothetical protein